MAVARPVQLVFNRIAEIDCTTVSPASGHLTDDTTASYNLQSHYKTPRPSAFSAMSSANSDQTGGNPEKIDAQRHFDRRSTQFEILRGLQVGERHPNRPPPFSGNMQLQRKMFGKSARYCVIKDGYLLIYRSKKEVDKGRVWRKIDLAHSVVSYRKADRIIMVNTDDMNELHRFKVEKDVFDEWVESLRLHRLYRQDQFAGEQFIGEPNTPRSPLTEYFPGIPTTRIDVSALDEVDSETSKRRVVEWLLDSEKMDSKDIECNEASMLVFELGSIIEQLEKFADLASERHSTAGVESPKESGSRSLLSRLSFRSRSHGRNDQADFAQKNLTPTPTLHSRPTLQIPSSISSCSVMTSSTPDVRKLPRSPTVSPSPCMKRISREESDLFHRDTWLREEYLRLAKEAHTKFRALLRAVNVEQIKLKALKEKWNANYLEKPTDSAAAFSTASSPVRRPQQSLYRNGDRSASTNVRHDVQDVSAKSNEKSPSADSYPLDVFHRLLLIRNLADLTYACLPDSPSYSLLGALVTPTGLMDPAWVCEPASVMDRQLERPSTVRTSSTVYYDAGEAPISSAITRPSPPVSDFGSSYTPSEIESDNYCDIKDADNAVSGSGSNSEKDDFADASDTVKRTSKDSAFLLPHYRERLPAYMPPAPSLFKLLYSAIGRDFTRFPLPIAALEPLSLLQVLCEELEYSELIDQAVAASDPNIRMVFVAAFAASRYGSTTFRLGRKPFNPLLGETFEFVSPNLGWRYVAEQTSHHPSISACYAEGVGWQWWQSVEATVVFGGRSVEARPITPVFLYLKKWKETYTWNKVTTYLTNLLSGPPFIIDHYGEMVVHCLGSQIKCKLHFEKMHSSSQRGNISGKVINKFGDVVHTVFGKWTDSFYLVEEAESTSRCIWRLAALLPDHERYYGLTRFSMALNELKPEVHGHIPRTDSRYRPDQRYLENGYVDDAEKAKKKLEADQRERLKVTREDDIPKWFRKSAEGNRIGAKWEFAGEYWKSKETGFKGVDLLHLW